MSDSKQMKFILSIRYYYILNCVGKKYGLWIFNPKCMVVPHFPLDNESCIFVLQCRDHTQGNLKMMIHPCRQSFHIIPLQLSYQMCHGIIKSCTVKILW